MATGRPPAVQVKSITLSETPSQRRSKGSPGLKGDRNLTRGTAAAYHVLYRCYETSIQRSGVPTVELHGIVVRAGVFGRPVDVLRIRGRAE